MVSFSLVLFPDGGEDWRPLYMTRLCVFIHALSCRVMRLQDAERICGYLSKKGIVPTRILETKKHRTASGRIWWNEGGKEQKFTFTAMKYFLGGILTHFSCFSSFTEKFYCRCCPGNILGLPSRRVGGIKTSFLMSFPFHGASDQYLSESLQQRTQATWTPWPCQ